MKRHGEIRALSSEENIGILQKSVFGHMACSTNDETYLVPITYAFSDGYIYSHSKLGKKIEMMRVNPNVCIQVEEVKSFFDWKSVIAWGKFEELKEDEAAVGMRLLVQKIAEKDPNGHISSLELDLMSLLETAVIFRIKIEKATGRVEGSY